MNTLQPVKIFFDVSGILLHLRKSNTYTGIQRVVTSVLAELVDTPNIYICWGRRGRRGYACAKLDGFGRDDLLDPRRMKAAFSISGPKRGVFPPLQYYVQNRTKYRFHFAKLWMSDLLGQERAFIRAGTTRQTWRAWRNVQAQTPAPRPLDFFETANSGDCVVLLDSTRNISKISSYLREAKNRDIRIVDVVYDLIPLMMPEAVPRHLPRFLYDSLYDSLAYVSKYVAISGSAGDDLQNFLSEHSSNHEIAVVPLAQEKLSVPDHSKGDLQRWMKTDRYLRVEAVAGLDDVIRSLAGSRYVLCVGTIEARKNHWRLLHAWDLLIKTLPHEQVPRLVIAGRKGWMIHDFERFLISSGHLNGFVTVIDAPSDDALDFLYRNCLFTIMPSLYEGWGLPVGESLSYGRTAVVANNSSLPEVGGDLVRYCDAMSVTSIMNACRDLIADPNLLTELEAKIASANLRRWKDVAHDLVAIALSDGA